MPIWINRWTLAQTKARTKGTMGEHLGIEVTDIGDDYISARMPVDERTVQPMGIVHGGASCVLAETIGSIAANMCCPPGSYSVGLEINANHIRAGRTAYVTGTARPVHIGSSTTVWDIRIEDAEGHLVCVSRLTTAILKKRADQGPQRVPDQAQEQAQQ